MTTVNVDSASDGSFFAEHQVGMETSTSCGNILEDEKRHTSSSLEEETSIDSAASETTVLSVIPSEEIVLPNECLEYEHISKQLVRKPFLGGFVNRESGVQYHHASTQTAFPTASREQSKVASLMMSFFPNAMRWPFNCTERTSFTGEFSSRDADSGNAIKISAVFSRCDHSSSQNRNLSGRRRFRTRTHSCRQAVLHFGTTSKTVEWNCRWTFFPLRFGELHVYQNELFKYFYRQLKFKSL